MTGINLPSDLVDTVTLAVFIGCAVLSIGLNLKDAVMKRRAARPTTRIGSRRQYLLQGMQVGFQLLFQGVVLGGGLLRYSATFSFVTR